MGNRVGGRRKAGVDERYTRPQGLYDHHDIDQKKLRKLILEAKLAPCYPGADEASGDLEECPICFLVTTREEISSPHPPLSPLTLVRAPLFRIPTAASARDAGWRESLRNDLLVDLRSLFFFFFWISDSVTGRVMTDECTRGSRRCSGSPSAQSFSTLI
jgi:hypothetical protein